MQLHKYTSHGLITWIRRVTPENGDKITNVIFDHDYDYIVYGTTHLVFMTISKGAMDYYLKLSAISNGNTWYVSPIFMNDDPMVFAILFDPLTLNQQFLIHISVKNSP